MLDSLQNIKVILFSISVICTPIYLSYFLCIYLYFVLCIICSVLCSIISVPSSNLQLLVLCHCLLCSVHCFGLHFPILCSLFWHKLPVFCPMFFVLCLQSSVINSPLLSAPVLCPQFTVFCSLSSTICCCLSFFSILCPSPFAFTCSPCFVVFCLVSSVLNSLFPVLYLLSFVLCRSSSFVLCPPYTIIGPVFFILCPLSLVPCFLSLIFAILWPLSSVLYHRYSSLSCCLLLWIFL